MPVEEDRMKRYIYLLVIPVVLAGSQWVRVSGGDGYDCISSLVATTDGYAVAGRTSSFGAGVWDVLLCRFDEAGHILWTRCLGGPYSDYGLSVATTSDGEFTVVGQTTSFGTGAWDIILSRFNAWGDHLWTKTLGGQDYDIGWIILGLEDDGVLVGGQTWGYGMGGADMILSRLNASGNHLWSRVLGWNGSDGLKQLIRTSDGGFALAGTTDSYSGNPDMIVCRLDSLGNPLWATVVGDTAVFHYQNGDSAIVLENDYGLGLVQTPDGGFVIVGYISNSHTYTNNIAIWRFDQLGRYQWTKLLKGPGSGEARSVILAPEGGFVVTSQTTGYGAGSKDIILSRFDASGQHIYSSVVGGAGADTAPVLVLTPDNGFLVAAQSESFGEGYMDILLSRFDSQGNTCIGESVYPSVAWRKPYVTDTIPLSSSINPTMTSANPTLASPMLEDTLICPTTIVEYAREPGTSLTVFNNTVRFILSEPGQVRLSVYDPVGRLVARPVDEGMDAGGHEVTIQLAPGVYFLELAAGGGILMAKALVR